MTDFDTNTQMLDITAPQVVEVSIRDDGKVLWINVDGICRLRAYQITTLIVEDKRNEENEVSDREEP